MTKKNLKAAVVNNSNNTANEVVNTTVVTVESLNVEVEDNTTTKGCKHGGQKLTANEMEDTPKESVAKFIYSQIKDTELESVKNSVSLKDLQKVDEKDFKNFLSKILSENENTERRNFVKLLNAAIQVCKESDKVTKKDLRTFFHAFRKTQGFTLTFQSEKDERTTTTYEGGAFYARPTTPTASGILTSFNSVQYTLRTEAQLRAKAAKAERLAKAKEILMANGVPESVLSIMADAAIISTAEKI